MRKDLLYRLLMRVRVCMCVGGGGECVFGFRCVCVCVLTRVFECAPVSVSTPLLQMPTLRHLLCLSRRDHVFHSSSSRDPCYVRPEATQCHVCPKVAQCCSS